MAACAETICFLGVGERQIVQLFRFRRSLVESGQVAPEIFFGMVGRLIRFVGRDFQLRTAGGYFNFADFQLLDPP